MDQTRCAGCGACVKACPRGAITAHAKLRPVRPVASAKSAPTPRSRAPKKPTEARPKPQGGFQWSLLEAGAILSVTFSAFLVKEAVTLMSGVQSLPQGLAVPVRIGVLTAYYAAQIAVLVWLVRRRGGDPLTALGLRRGALQPKRALTAVALVVGLLIATRTFGVLYAFVTRVVGLAPVDSSLDLPGLFGADALGVALAVLMVVIVGPVIEEAVFRGALQPSLAVRIGVWPAILAQAVVFSLLHRSIWLLVPLTVLGIALGWLTKRCGSLWPAISLHAAYNGLSVAAAFLTS